MRVSGRIELTEEKSEKFLGRVSNETDARESKRSFKEESVVQE